MKARRQRFVFVIAPEPGQGKLRIIIYERKERNVMRKTKIHSGAAEPGKPF